jgi:diguanylate cyclase (GGDEF)-like protein/PAS domain S-box-containing protein
VVDWSIVPNAVGDSRISDKTAGGQTLPRSREFFLWRLMTPPVYEDEHKTAITGGLYAISWALLLIVAPLVVVLGLLIPTMFWVCLEIALGLAFSAAVTLFLSYHERRTVAGLWLLSSVWLLFFSVVWQTGGTASPAVVSLFVIVIITGAVRDWQWGVVVAAVGILATMLLAWVQTAGKLPPSSVIWTPWIAGASYAAYFIALGALQAVMAANLKRTRGRVNTALEQRRIAEKRLLDVVDNAPFGAIVADTVDGGQLRVTHVNRAASEVLGLDATEFVGGSIGEAFWALSGEEILTRFKEIARNGGTDHSETVPYYSGGRRGSLEIHAFQIAEGSMAVFFSDVTERRREQVEMHRMAFHDELTALPNRKLLLDRLEMALAGGRRRNTQVALLFIDLDNFKPINDRHGHPFGDELLIAVGARLRDNARRTDTVARFGGDEFTVLMPDVTSVDQVTVVAEKLVAALSEPFEVEGRQVRTAASIGVALTDDTTFTADALLERADMLMYQVKRAGRNGYRIG